MAPRYAPAVDSVKIAGAVAGANRFPAVASELQGWYRSCTGPMKGKPDYYWRKSKQHGYPARSVWKLAEMQERYAILHPGDHVLDLGCSPGSWSLAALDILAGRGTVLGVDRAEPDPMLASRPGFSFLRGDLTSEQMRALLASRGPFDAVLSDAAPSTTGNRILDTARSLEIGRAVLSISDACLRPGGALVLKIFPGGEEGELLDSMRRRFAEARVVKPRASRSDSMEIYLLGLRRLAARDSLAP